MPQTKLTKLCCLQHFYLNSSDLSHRNGSWLTDHRLIRVMVPWGMWNPSRVVSATGAWGTVKGTKLLCRSVSVMKLMTTGTCPLSEYLRASVNILKQELRSATSTKQRNRVSEVRMRMRMRAISAFKGFAKKIKMS